MLFVNVPRASTVKAEIIYITAEKVIFHRILTLSEATTVGEALSISGVYEHHPEMVCLEIGIFAKRVTKESPVKEGDRIEIYRPLTKTPKERRRQQARNRS